MINGAEITSPAAAPQSVTYNYNLTGSTMVVTINFGAGFWQYTMEKNAVSTDEVVTDMFSVYPNPASNEIMVTSNEQLDQITIRDITGRVVLMQPSPDLNATIDVSNLASGMYILKSRLGNLISVEKLSVQ